MSFPLPDNIVELPTRLGGSTTGSKDEPRKGQKEPEPPSSTIGTEGADGAVQTSSHRSAPSHPGESAGGSASSSADPPRLHPSLLTAYLRGFQDGADWAVEQLREGLSKTRSRR